jgi:murein peptide amidase A
MIIVRFILILLLVIPCMRTYSAVNEPIQSAVYKPELQLFCTRLHKTLPRTSLEQCINSGLKNSGSSSVRGVPLYAHEAVPVQAAPPKQAMLMSGLTVPRSTKAPLRVLLIGGIHGDELTSPEIVLSWIRRLNETEASAYHWKVIPLLNPDGFFMPKPQRTNANGVDLNRNFPTTDWATKAKYYWEKQVAKDPRRYPGKAPLSEPESKWLHDQIESFKPHAIVSVHAPLGVLDFDGPAPAPRKIGRLYLDQVGVYPGSLGNYSGIQKGVPVVTLELPHALNMPSSFEQDRMWRDMLAWLKQRSALVLSAQ